MFSGAALDLDEVHRLSTDEYHRLVESGGFDENARVELVDGLLADMGPKTREHENAIAWLAPRLMLTVDQERYEVRVASALTLASSEPEPDLAVIPHDAPRPYHPATAALVVEVSVSSLRRDLLTKSALYAAGGVDEYWVVDLDGRRAVMHRDPLPDGYAEVAEVGTGGDLVAERLALGELALAELLSAAIA